MSERQSQRDRQRVRERERVLEGERYGINLSNMRYNGQDIEYEYG